MNQICKTKDLCRGYAIMHRLCVYRYMYRYKLFVLCLFITQISTLFTSSLSIFDPGDDKQHLYIINLCINFILFCTFCAFIFSDFKQVSFLHGMATFRFSQLARQAEQYLSKPLSTTTKNNHRTTTMDQYQFQIFIMNEFDNVLQNSPSVPRDIYINYVKSARQKGIHVPEEYGLEALSFKDVLERKKKYMQMQLGNQLISSCTPPEKVHNKNTTTVKIDVNPEGDGEGKVCNKKNDQERTQTNNLHEDKKQSNTLYQYEIQRLLYNNTNE